MPNSEDLKEVSGKIPSFDGTSIYYEKHGTQSSRTTPIIFCYGLVCAMTQWRYQVSWFKSKTNCILVDYRGHHNSSMPRDLNSVTIENCAKDVLAVMDHLKISKAHIVGHSMGSNVGMVLALHFPKRVASLVSVCGSVVNPFETMFHTHLMQYFFEFLKKYHELSPKTVEVLWRRIVSNNPLNRALVASFGFNRKLIGSHDIDVYLEGVGRVPISIFKRLLEDMQQSLIDILPQIKIPVLVVSGEKDHIQPPINQRTLYEKLPQAQWMSIPYGSHCAHMDMHEYVNLRMEKFYQELKSSSQKTKVGA